LPISSFAKNFKLFLKSFTLFIQSWVVLIIMNKIKRNKIWEEIAASLNQEEFDQEIAAPGNMDLSQIREIDSLLKKDKKLIDLLLQTDTSRAWRILKSKKSNRVSFIKKMLAYAAGVVLLIASGYMLNTWMNSKSAEKGSCVVFSVPNAEMGNVVLADGTKVVLNSASELKYPSALTKQREVFLKGEAYFDVKSDKGDPFLVYLDDFTIKVTGTQFNVKSYPKCNTEATLVEGEISILNKKGAEIAKIKPDESVVFDRSTGKITVNRVNTQARTEWRNGKIYLKNKTIEEIAHTLERWYDVRIEFENESIKKVRLTGTILKNKPIEQILEILKISEPLDFEYKYENQVLTIIKIRHMN
jgi:transmembrane sensor